MESQMQWKAGTTVMGDRDNQPCGCGASSMPQTRGLPRNPLHTAECWSIVYFLYTYAVPHCAVVFSALCSAL